jgi:hypothetical protein
LKKETSNEQDQKHNSQHEVALLGWQHWCVGRIGHGHGAQILMPGDWKATEVKRLLDRASHLSIISQDIEHEARALRELAQELERKLAGPRYTDINWFSPWSVWKALRSNPK